MRPVQSLTTSAAPNRIQCPRRKSITDAPIKRGAGDCPVERLGPWRNQREQRVTGVGILDRLDRAIRVRHGLTTVVASRHNRGRQNRSKVLDAVEVIPHRPVIRLPRLQRPRNVENSRKAEKTFVCAQIVSERHTLVRKYR